jgi:hypothetical protein
MVPLLDAARAACACKALRLAAAAAAARVQRLANAAAWGVEQPSVDAVSYAAKRCTRLQTVWLGVRAFDDHLFALRRCAPPPLSRSARWRQSPLVSADLAAPQRSRSV